MQSSALSNISDSYSLISPLELVKTELDQVKKLINEYLTISGSKTLLNNNPSEEKNDGIDNLFSLLRTRSGKMVRSGLILLTGKYFNCLTEKHFQVAACIEMIHNATLLHDDVIDEGQQRRGKPTINLLRGNESAILLGDFLLSRVFKLSAEFEPDIIKIIASAAVILCEGELGQIVQQNNWQLSEDEYIDVITSKSAYLFETCCKLGAKLANADDSQIKLFSEFGLNAGIAFQIKDDLLDITGDEKKTGKTSGRDVNKNKPTLAVIHLLGNLDKSDREKIIKSYFEENDSVSDKNTLIDILKSNGSLEYAANKAQQYVSNAIASLEKLPENPAKKALIETAKFMANRNC